MVGTSHVSFEISPAEWKELEELCREEGVEPFEGTQGVSPAGGEERPVVQPASASLPGSSADAAPASAAASSPSSAGDLQECDGIPWALNGHSVVQASLHPIAEGAPSVPDLICCKACGASLHRNVRPGEGLDGVCRGRETPGLRSQRARLRRGLAPRIEARLDSVRGPDMECKAAWAARLPSLTSLGTDSGARGGQAAGVGLSQSRAFSPCYGTKVPELDDWAVAQLHGFVSPGAAVEFGRAQRVTEDEVFEDPNEG